LSEECFSFFSSFFATAGDGLDKFAGCPGN